MSEKRIKEAMKKAKRFLENHKEAVIFGMTILQDEKLLANIRQALVEKIVKDYQKREEALDYASK